MFGGGSIRALLYNHHQLLQGDVCTECMQLGASRFRQKLHDRASLLLKISQMDDEMRVAQRQRALELLDLAKEAVHFPAPYQWWWKRLEVLSEDAEDLPHPDAYREERSRLDQLLEHDRDFS
jgi:hypothetical protein